MARAILAVLCGYAVWTGLWLGGNAGIQAIWPAAFPDAGPIDAAAPLGAVLALSCACSLVAGRVAGAIAHPRQGPVTVMAVALLATGIFVQASVWDRMPLWFHLPFLLLIVPLCVVGAGRPDPR